MVLWTFLLEAPGVGEFGVQQIVLASVGTTGFSPTPDTSGPQDKVEMEAPYHMRKYVKVITKAIKLVNKTSYSATLTIYPYNDKCV